MDVTRFIGNSVRTTKDTHCSTLHSLVSVNASESTLYYSPSDTAVSFCTFPHCFHTRTICVVDLDFAFHTTRRTVAVTHWNVGKRYFYLRDSCIVKVGWASHVSYQLKPATRSTRLYSSGLTTEVRSPVPRSPAPIKAIEHSPHLGKPCGFVLRIFTAEKLRIDSNQLAIWSRIANIVRTVLSMRTVFFTYRQQSIASTRSVD